MALSKVSIRQAEPGYPQILSVGDLVSRPNEVRTGHPDHGSEMVAGQAIHLVRAET